MSVSRISLNDVPKLSHDPSSYAPWRTTIEVSLQLADCWNSVLGVDLEPGRAVYATATHGPDGGIITQPTRNVRAGSMQPGALETGTNLPLTSDVRKDWERWQAREGRAQGMLKGTVSMAIKLDLEDSLDAHSMWLYCERLHSISIKENQREVQRKLFSFDLRDDATSEEMAAHIEDFSQTVMHARMVGLSFSSLDRASLFMQSILAPSFRPVLTELNSISDLLRDWPTVLSKYNAESARRKARPLPRARGGVVMAVTGPRVTREAAARSRDRPRRDMSTVECYNCGKQGHFARDCRSAKKADNRDSVERTGKTKSDRQPKAKLSSALFDEQSAWIGITTAQGAVEDLADLSQYEDNRPIEWPEMAEENPWNEMPQINFADDCVMDISGEPIKPVWVVDSGATHHLTPHRGLLRQVRPLAEPQIFGLADKKTTMTASEVGEVELELPSSQKMILKDVYLVPDSRISLISLSRMLRAGWRADMTGSGGQLKRAKETLTLDKRGSLWTVILGIVRPRVMLATGHSMARTPLEIEHQRLGHIGTDRLLELARGGKLKEGFGTYKNDPFKTADC